MLTIKCAKCKAKIMKYKKIGEGRVLRCWESKINRMYEGKVEDKDLICGECGNIIGEIKENKKGTRFVDMNRESFTFTGTKISK